MRFRTIIAVLVMAVAIVSQSYAAGKGVVVDGSTTVGPVAKSFAAYFTSHQGVPVTVSESGSGNGAKSLINGSCDIAAMSRKMRDKEVAAARKQGVDPVATVIAVDGIAMIVNPANPVANLTRRQIAGIYQGRLVNWRELGGPNAPIVVIQRESNSGTQASFIDLVVGSERPVTKRAETQASNGAMKNRVAATPTSIGFIGLGFLDPSVKVLAVDGVMPDEATVRSATYPISRPLYFYTAGTPKGNVGRFVGLASTPEGVRIIEELGFISR